MPTDRDRYSSTPASGPRNSRSGVYSSSTRGSTGGGSRYAQDAYERQQTTARNSAYLKQLQDLIYGTGYDTGFDLGGGGSSGGGGGGGGYDPYAAQRADEERRRAELERRKADLTKQLQGARGQALPLLNQYSARYGKDINNVFAQNRGLNAGYAKQLQALAAQINQGTQGTQQMLQRDLTGQGAGGPELQALSAAANQGVAGTDFLSQLGQQYNTRLAQAMAAAQADAQSMGSAIKASSLGNLENSYANALAQIGLMGLT